MATADSTGGAGMGFLGLLSFRRNPVASVDPAQEDELHEMDQFQAELAHRLLSLAQPDPAQTQTQNQNQVLTFAFVAKLLGAVLDTDADFRELIAGGCDGAGGRIAGDLADRAVRCLDVLNSASLSLAAVRHSLRAAVLAAAVAGGGYGDFGRANLSRASRALSKFFAGGVGPSKKGASFSAGAGGRTPSFCMSKSWSSSSFSSSSPSTAAAAHHHHHAMPPPPPGGVALAVYTMSSLLAFSMWALTVAVSGGGGGAPPLAPPRNLQWAAPMAALQERIAGEWKKREKKSPSGFVAPGMAGLLAEMQAVERAARSLMQHLDELAEEGDAIGGDALDGERAREVGERAEELAEACRALDDGLGPLERLVRAVFHRVAASCAEVMRSLEHGAGGRTSANANASSSASVLASHHAIYF